MGERDNSWEEHHPWCNYFYRPNPQKCKMCERLYKEYPINGMTLDEMMGKYFPDVIIR